MLGTFTTDWDDQPAEAPRDFAAAVEEIRQLHLEAARARAAAVAADDDTISADLHRLANGYDREARNLNLVVMTREART